MAEEFTCNICQQKLSLTNQLFDLEGACNNCAYEESQFQCSCCGNYFPKEECASCDDICDECDEDGD